MGVGSPVRCCFRLHLGAVGRLPVSDELSPVLRISCHGAPQRNAGASDTPRGAYGSGDQADSYTGPAVPISPTVRRLARRTPPQFCSPAVILLIDSLTIRSGCYWYVRAFNCCSFRTGRDGHASRASCFRWATLLIMRRSLRRQHG